MRQDKAKIWTRRFQMETGVRYLFLSSILLLLAFAQVVSRSWEGDFWVHAAVVRELATHPFAPQHPQLVSAAPHMLYSPYAVGLGWLAALFRCDALTILSVFSVINLVLLLIGLRFFVGSYLKGDPRTVSFYALLLILFLWGHGPWFWSSFVHMDVLPFVLPYPSVFALGLTLVCLANWARWLGALTPARIAIQTMMMALLVTTHPLTWILHVVFGAGLVLERASTKRDALSFGVCVIAGFGLGLLWPYYSLSSLLSLDTSEFHVYNRELYENVWIRAYPMLLCIPIVLMRMRQNARDAMAWSLLVLLGLYAYGRLSHQEGYGRTIAHAGLVVQLAMASTLAALEHRARGRRLLPLIALALVFAGLAQLAAKTNLSIRTFTRRTDRVAPWEFLREVDQNAVVLSTPEVSWHVPALGGKVVAVHHPVYWVDDFDERRADSERFFSSDTDAAARTEILARHDVDYLLVPTEANRLGLDTWGETVTRTDGYQLVRVAQ